MVVLFLLSIAMVWALINQRNVMRELKEETKHILEETMEEKQDAKHLDL
jgi:hypothetical protein